MDGLLGFERVLWVSLKGNWDPKSFATQSCTSFDWESSEYGGNLPMKKPLINNDNYIENHHQRWHDDDDQLGRGRRQRGFRELWSCPRYLLRNMCTSSFGNAVIIITIITILTPPAYCTHQEAWLDILSTTHTSHPCWLPSFLVTLLSDILNHDKVHHHLCRELHKLLGQTSFVFFCTFTHCRYPGNIKLSTYNWWRPNSKYKSSIWSWSLQI